MSCQAKLKKAALVLKNLPQAQSDKILSRLEANDLRTVFQAINELDVNTTRPFFDALSDLARESQQQFSPPQSDGEATAETTPIVASPQQLADAQDNSFGFLFSRSADDICGLLADEHPRAIATVIMHLPQQVSAQILRSLEPVQRVSVVKRMCETREPVAAEVSSLALALKQRLLKRDQSRAIHPDRKSQIAGIMQWVGPEVSTQLREQMPGDMPVLDELARDHGGSIEVLKTCDQQEIRRLFPQANHEIWAAALRHACPTIRQLVMKSIDPADAKQVESHLRAEYIAVNLTPRAAQRRIADALASLRWSAQ